jgi:hemerythrin-like domain-containing protein
MAVQTKTGADATTLLEADHREVERLFEEIKKTKGEGRRQLIDKMANELRLHMQVEEELVYPTLEDLDQELTEEAEAEHELARHGLEDVLALAPDQPGFDAAIELLATGVKHHVEEEEKEAFPKLRRSLGDEGLRRLGGEIEAAKQQGAARPASRRKSDTREQPTKAELVKQARAKGIKGYSSMKKDELIEALDRA